MTSVRPLLRQSARVAIAALVLVTAVLMTARPSQAQARLSYSKGQNVSPAYEGWIEKADGSRYFMFGYMNRNWEEEPNVPIGAENGFSPGPADRGQPTHFLPRRNRFIFEVPVPAGFTEEDELIWTLRVNGVEEKAYASLRPDYLVDNVVIASETGALGAGTSSPEMRSNTPPIVEVQGPTHLSARVGQPILLRAKVTDDGIPRTRAGGGAGGSTGSVSERRNAAQQAGEAAADSISPEQRALARALRPPARVTVGKIVGLYFSWFPYHAPGKVSFSIPQVKTWEDTRTAANSPWAALWQPPMLPEDGIWAVHATFDTPGTYVLRGRADDGGLYGDQEVTVTVTP